MKLLMESWRKFINEEKELTPKIVTVDFDDTLKMKDSNIVNWDIINKIKELASNGAKIYVVSRRKPEEVFEKGYENAEDEINSFINDNNLPIDGIYLTSWQNKGKILDELGSDMHIDDSDKTWRELEQDYPNIKLIKVDHETGEIKSDLEESAPPGKKKQVERLKQKLCGGKNDCPQAFKMSWAQHNRSEKKNRL